MPYFVISDFKAGVDTRYPVFVEHPGTLSIGQDVHLTTAGHIEVRKAFVKLTTLPADTFGLAAKNDTVYVFGSNAAPGGLPTGFAYQRLQHPTGAMMTDILDIELFDGKFYTISAYTSDIVHHFDGTRGADWQIATDVADPKKFSGGAAAKTLGEKVYVVDGANLNFSKIAEPLLFQTETDTPANTGAGFVNMSVHSAGSEELVGCELYYDSLAVFSKENVQLWRMTSDPTTNARIQTLRGAGLVAPRASISYLDGDTFFLSYQGVRNVRPRDSSSGRSVCQRASAPVDKQLIPYQKSLSADLLAKACMIQEPDENRLLVFLGDRAYVMSHFPDAGVHAWTQYQMGFNVTAAAVCERRLYVRDDQDNVYLYGGANDDEYFAGQAVVRLPYVTARAPATFKDLSAFDAGVEGQWSVWISTDPDVENSFVRTAIITGQTFTDPNYALTGGGTTHLSMEFRHEGAEYARLSVIALHYQTQTSG